MKKEFKAILFCLGFIIILLIVKAEDSTVITWVFVSLFSLVILFCVARLFNISNRFERKDNNLWKKISSENFKKLEEDPGIFSYENSSFTFPYFEDIKKYKWTDINTLVAYKEDLNTTDEVYLRIKFSDKLIFLISESTPGWYKFIDQLKKNISVSELWDTNIIHPPFATNMTVVFDKEGRDDKTAIDDTFNE